MQLRERMQLHQPTHGTLLAHISPPRPFFGFFFLSDQSIDESKTTLTSSLQSAAPRRLGARPTGPYRYYNMHAIHVGQVFLPVV